MNFMIHTQYELSLICIFCLDQTVNSTESDFDGDDEDDDDQRSLFNNFHILLYFDWHTIIYLDRTLIIPENILNVAPNNTQLNAVHEQPATIGTTEIASYLHN